MLEPDKTAEAIQQGFKELKPIERLQKIRNTIKGKLVFTTSLGLEDQVLTHLIAKSGIDIDITTLDTGRLFPETYTLWAQTEATYKLRIKPCFPDKQAVENFVSSEGINGFYHSLDARKTCCHIRKVEPLNIALKQAAGWLTGIRADQSEHRHTLHFATHDQARSLIKINPLLDWSREEAVHFAKKHHVPINPLHENGYLSIGCAPCTRAVAAGEPERAGRWWWETSDKECGLHFDENGKIIPNLIKQAEIHL